MDEQNEYLSYYLFDEHFDAFVKFVEPNLGEGFRSFGSNTYTDIQEGYKLEVYSIAKKALRIDDWNQSEIGTGAIVRRVLSAIEFEENNLVQWRSKWGEKSRPHHPLHLAANEGINLNEIETALFKHFTSNNYEEAFAELVGLFGKKYDLIAYLFFLKDRSRFLPIAARYFDSSFEKLGIDLKTSHRASWENYTEFLEAIGSVRALLEKKLKCEVTLLEAHSFVWILSMQMESEGALPDVSEYLELPATERIAIGKARIGQGFFRKSLLKFWSGRCSVTGCDEKSLLEAAHIKPWILASATDRINSANGLILTPNIHKALDAGFISFASNGAIIISTKLTKKNAETLGVDETMRLRLVDDKHKPFLKFHRNNVLKK